MLALFLALMAAAWLIGAADAASNYQVYGSVMFIRTGERTPELVTDKPRTLSAVGSNQMYSLGSNVRGRYINAAYGDIGLGQQQILGLSQSLLNNDQVYIMTQDEPFLIASAQAFMQGLYPPFSLNSTSSGTIADASGVLANGTAIDAPLGGYQYPEIHVASELDPNSIYLAGQQNCPTSQQQSLMYYISPQFLATDHASESTYNALDASYLGGYLDQSLINYYNAYFVYDYLNYAYMHDNDVYNKLANDSAFQSVYDDLRYYANEQAWYKYGNSSDASTSSNLRSMAGKTLAALILGQFQKIVSNSGNVTNGESHPLSLFFGEYEPFVSLFSDMEIAAMSNLFEAIPPYGSSIVFELFSLGSGSDPFPEDESDLWVRFAFVNGTNYLGSLQSYPMFNQGPSQTDMPWTEFQNLMSRIMVNTLSDWCDQCDSSALFCWGVENSTINIDVTENKKYKVTPAVAGVIGAVVTLAVAGLAFALLLLVGGFRVHRPNRGKRSELGGFKGSSKLASDPDLASPKGGATAGIVGFGAADAKRKPHERVGSWELRQKEFGNGDAKSADMGDDSRRASFDAIEATMAKPTQPRESV